MFKHQWNFNALSVAIIAALARTGTQTILTKLGQLMNKCTTCHASYRIDAETENNTN